MRTPFDCDEKTLKEALMSALSYSSIIIEIPEHKKSCQEVNQVEAKKKELRVKIQEVERKVNDDV